MSQLRVKAHGPQIEDELLLLCARTCQEEASLDRIRKLCDRPGIDWARLFQIAIWHKVMPLLFRSLSAACPEAVPEREMRTLEGQFRANALRNVHLAGEMVNILGHFEEHGVIAIPYKGPALAASVYGDLALRQSGDLDILVRQRDVPRAAGLLVARGYQPLFQLEERQLAARLRTGQECQFVRKSGRVIVELHWRIVAHWQLSFSWASDLEGLVERHERLPLAGTMVRVLSPEDLVLALCVHGACHHWERLGWICDLGELIRVRHGLDWGWIVKQACRTGSERMLLLGLALVQGLFGAVLPEEVTQRLEGNPVVTSLAVQVREWLFHGEGRRIGLSEESAFFVQIRERPWDRLPYYVIYLRAYIRALVSPTGKDRAFLPLPEFCSSLYYLVRPVRLARDHVLGPLKSLLRR